MARMYGARTASRAYRDRARQRRRAAVRGSVKWLCYAVTAFLLCALEGTFFAFFGASVAHSGYPYLLPAWVAAVAMYEGARGGAWFGIAVGLLSSAAGGDALYVLPLFYMFYGLLIGLFGARYLKKGFFIYLGYEIVICALHGGLLLLLSLISAAVAGESLGAVIGLLGTSALYGAAASSVWSLFLYLPLMLVRCVTKNPLHGQDALHS
ncbi:MAG: hypothetical protein IKZ09_07345 [Clostridia bacterium]|nr:hypothetical protein [Clostridia bacterium]